MINTLNAQAPRVLAILRVVTGLLFLQHGTQKLFGFPPSEMGQPPIASLMGVGGILELVGSILIIIGFQTRITAFILSGMMAVAYWMFHAPSSIYPVLNGGELAIMYCFVFLYMVFAGPGAWSVDGSRKAAV
ncbi:DoxX family protein [Pseudoruegeria sp. HB172150]|uniref:DoxX family protein n=1 Tax=Pseudoruegeria sp. HB172150 TaxID=2721164 RepID=UPI001557D77D|nr:DoxX family protein [Pseudoruegeria sp. HB172150]